MKIQRYSIDQWKPNAEDIDWDSRFLIDRIFEIEKPFFRYRIRFVQYPGCGREEIDVFIIRIFKMPKLYWRYVERTMKPPFFHDWLIKSESHFMTFSEVYDRFGYELRRVDV